MISILTKVGRRRRRRRRRNLVIQSLGISQGNGRGKKGIRLKPIDEKNVILWLLYYIYLGRIMNLYILHLSIQTYFRNNVSVKKIVTFFTTLDFIPFYSICVYSYITYHVLDQSEFICQGKS